MYSLHKQENPFTGILLCGICTLSPLAPSPLILPPSLLRILDAFYLTRFWKSGAAGWQDVWVSFLAVMRVSVKESKHELS